MSDQRVVIPKLLTVSATAARPSGNLATDGYQSPNERVSSSLFANHPSSITIKLAPSSFAYTTNTIVKYNSQVMVRHGH